MSDMELMQQNLARLLSHHSLPQLLESEPADPFQKRQFGKKMKKSALQPVSDVTNHNSHFNSSKLSADEDQPLSYMHNLNMHLNDPFGRIEKHEEEIDKKLREINKLFSRLKGNLDGLEDEYRQKVIKMYTNVGNRKREQCIDEFIGNLQGSVQFILNDCLSLKQDRKLTQIEQPQKKKRAESDKQNFRGNLHPNAEKGKAKSKEGKSNQKSIYESVLQERQRRSKKRMI